MERVSAGFVSDTKEVLTVKASVLYKWLTYSAIVISVLLCLFMLQACLLYTSQPACELSGGNQQKVVFAKALLTSPSIWLCDEPTQAVDVATRQQIHSLLRTQASENKAVLYVSSDLTELLEVADEIAVMASGKIRKIFPNKNLKPADIL